MKLLEGFEQRKVTIWLMHSDGWVEIVLEWVYLRTFHL